MTEIKTDKKVFYSLKHKDGGFFGGNEDAPVNRWWYLYVYSVGNERCKAMRNPSFWELAESPVQDERKAWGIANSWRD